MFIYYLFFVFSILLLPNIGFSDSLSAVTHLNYGHVQINDNDSHYITIDPQSGNYRTSNLEIIEAPTLGVYSVSCDKTNKKIKLGVTYRTPHPKVSIRNVDIFYKEKLYTNLHGSTDLPNPGRDPILIYVGGTADIKPKANEGWNNSILDITVKCPKKRNNGDDNDDDDDDDDDDDNNGTDTRRGGISSDNDNNRGSDDDD